MGLILYSVPVAKKISVSKARRPAAPSVPRAASSKKPPLTVSIDYPLGGEAVHPGHYSIRLTAAGAGQAQVRFDGGDWLDCREALGHHWFDWAPQAGPALIEARARAGKGRWTAAAARGCIVAA